MKDIANMNHCSIIDAICPYEHSCSVCLLHSDYETAKEKAKKLAEKLEEGHNDAEDALRIALSAVIRIDDIEHRLKNVYGDCDGLLDKVVEYLEKHKATCEWIPCSERLPEEPDPELSDMDVFPEYIVMIEDEELPTVLEYFGHGKWYREGIYYRVVAWRPLPEPYKLQEMSK